MKNHFESEATEEKLLDLCQDAFREITGDTQ